MDSLKRFEPKKQKHKKQKAEQKAGTEDEEALPLLGEYEGWLQQLSTAGAGGGGGGGGGVEEDQGTAAVAMRCLSLMMGRCDVVVGGEGGGRGGGAGTGANWAHGPGPGRCYGHGAMSWAWAHHMP